MTINPDATNTETILHAWSWNFPEISKNMKKIADSGFTMVQTSPVQHCFQPEGSGKKIFDDNVTEGNWYYYYQPTDWKIGNNIVGTKQQMQEMMDSAKKYNIKVIVDVLPNHTAFDVDAVSDDFYKAVGGREKMFHSKGLDPINNYQDREQCTLWAMGGLPDVNTENPDFQKYYLQFVNELLGMGVKGFRYDTAKHIGVHSDPVDAASGVKENDFWDVVTGRKTVKGVRLAVPYDSLFVYGEVLQDKGVPEAEYADYMGQTASGYGHVLREMLEKRNANGIDFASYHHQAAPEYLTTWVESHDTYANAHESAHLTDAQIREGWVFLTARQNGTPLFFSRPAGSTRQNYWGNNVLGARGNDEFMHPEVTAVNKFRRQMARQKENLQKSENGQVLLVNRGKKGAAIINLGTLSNVVDLPTDLPNGTYKDIVYNKEFKVKNGRIKGLAAPEKSYIIVKN
ncbi:alpha-amylase family glycosyl hydrolase [Turicimonas muris]|uniref:alpha-amylase family glycosyl hydrolase n=1 Tax=Turicimonas muris TaxID=1796652 RepID=UPI002637CE87|nr:alpha-amylase family glycosyl hydrolase [Turicimonas muris]